MNGSLPIEQRLLVRIVAFLSIVCFGIHNVNSTVRSSGSHAAADNADGRLSSAAHPKNNRHIQIQAINSSPNTPKNNSSVRISFELHDPEVLPYRNAFAPHGCDIGPLAKGGTRTAAIPPSLLLGVQSNGGRVLDFTTTISTDLNILQIGDSVTIQIAEALDEMLGGLELNSRQVVWEAWPGADGGTRVAPTRGGGMHGAWRITGLLSKAGRGRPPTKNARGGGWNYWQVNPFLKHVYEWEGREVKVEHVDAVVFRVMHGWMEIHEITQERVVEAAEMAHSILGASAIVFMTVPFTNNVKTVEIMEAVRDINGMIRDIARGWHHEHDTRFLVMEYAMYCNHIIWANARHTGYNVSDPLTSHPEMFDAEGPNFLLERLKEHVWAPSVPMVCNRRPTPESRGTHCEQNYLFNDGMHICAETLAARVGAGLSCLLGCAFNRKGPSEPFHEDKDNLQWAEARVSRMRECERECNEQFFSVTPVKNSWVVDPNVALASFSGI